MKQLRQSKWKQVLIASVVLLFVAGLVTVFTRFKTKPETGKAAVTWELPAQPIRVAWYYAWFFGNTSDPNRGLDWGRWSPYVAALSQRQNQSYHSTEARTYRQHINDMNYGKYDAAAFSWRSQTAYHSRCTDDRGPGDSQVPVYRGFTTNDTSQCLLGRMMEDSKNTPLKWTILDELENFEGKTLEETKSDLRFFRDHFFNRPNFLRVNGKPVIFVFNTPRTNIGEDQCDVVARWQTAQQQTGIDIYFSPKVAGAAFDTCPVQPEAWFNWNVNLTKNGVKLSHAIRPGFWDPLDSQYNTDQDNQYDKYTRREPANWANEVRAQVNSGYKWQFTETFNDWGEGSSVEAAVDCTARIYTSGSITEDGPARCQPHPNGWQTSSGYGLYLDALHNNPPRPDGTDPPTVSISANDTTITAGSNITITWTASGADSCTASGGATGWPGAKSTSGGSQSLTQSVTRTYTIACTNTNGTTTESVTVTVGSVPTVVLAASPTTVASGGSTILTWTVNNDATSCTASGSWTGSKAAGGGTQTMTNITANKTYNLVCANNFGSSTPLSTVSVTVSSTPPPTVTLTVSRITMRAGETAVLAWSSTNATSCNATGSWTGAKATSGNQTVNPINDVLYNLVCTGSNGSNSAVTGIDVTPSLVQGDIANPPNGDGVVNLDDFQFLLFTWGTNHTRSDLNGSGSVDWADLSLWTVYNRLYYESL